MTTKVNPIKALKEGDALALEKIRNREEKGWQKESCSNGHFVFYTTFGWYCARCGFFHKWLAKELKEIYGSLL